MRTHLLALATAATFAMAAAAAERPETRATAQPVALRMAIGGACPAEDEVLAGARDEVRRIWSRAGIAIEWVEPARLPFASSGTDWLLVRCSGDAIVPLNPAEPRVLPIAAIRFIGSLPTNTIVLSLANADTLLRQDGLEARDPRAWVKPFRRTRLARMLGRALAHEVGHFLTQSRTHTAGGLMRATHSVAALTGVSLGPFRVDPEQVLPLRIARGRPAAPSS